MYFTPEMKLLEQYSKTKQEKLLHHLKKDHKHGQPKDDRGLPKRQISKDKLESVLISMSEISFFKTLKLYTEKSFGVLLCCSFESQFKYWNRNFSFQILISVIKSQFQYLNRNFSF